MNIILFNDNEKDIKLAITDNRAKHITGILKSKAGDSIDIGIINGPKGKALIKSIDNTGIEFDITLDQDIPELYPVTLVCGLTRPQSVKKILKETTALGVEKIYFTAAELGEKSYISSKIWKDDYYKRYLILGAEQAFCTRLPEVKIFYSLDFCLKELSTSNQSLFALDNYTAGKSLNSVKNIKHSAVLAIGPERGWSDNERSILRNNDFKVYNIGKRILRTETASVAGITILLSKMGYM